MESQIFLGKGKARRADRASQIPRIDGVAVFKNLYTRELQPPIDMDIKEAMESVLLSDIKDWETENLFENQVVIRNKAFKK